MGRASSGRSGAGVHGELWLGPAVWLAVAVLGSAYPALVQTLVVKPNEAVLERPYLAAGRALSRVAYGLEGLAERDVETIDPAGAETSSRSTSVAGSCAALGPGADPE